MDKNLTTSGFDLYEVEQDQWVFHIKGGSIYIGSFRKVAIYMVTRIGFKLEEIQAATKEMIEKDHNAAHFGIYRGFISTFKKEFKYARQFKAG